MSNGLSSRRVFPPNYRTLDVDAFTMDHWYLVADHWMKRIKLRGQWSVSLLTTVPLYFKGTEGYETLRQVLRECSDMTKGHQRQQQQQQQKHHRHHRHQQQQQQENIHLVVDNATVTYCSQMLLELGFVQDNEGKFGQFKKNGYYCFTEKLPVSGARNLYDWALPLPVCTDQEQYEGKEKLSNRNPARKPPRKKLSFLGRLISGQFSLSQNNTIDDNTDLFQHSGSDGAGGGCGRNENNGDDADEEKKQFMIDGELIREKHYETLDVILNDPQVRKVFRAFCLREHSEEYVDYWTLINNNIRPLLMDRDHDIEDDDGNDEERMHKLSDGICDIYNIFVKPGARRQLNFISQVQKQWQNLVAALKDPNKRGQGDNELLISIRALLDTTEDNVMKDMHDIRARFEEAIRHLNS